MIGYINGLIIDKDEKRLLVLAQSIGYDIKVTAEKFAVSKVDQKVQLFIHTAVREDDISLYGFSGKAELKFFRQLIGISGVGPKMAMEILSCPMSYTQKAIIAEDIDMLTEIKGVGKKTAERIILELKNKIVPAAPVPGGEAESAFNEEAVSALVNLGYDRFYIVKALAAIPAQITETEEMIKYFLKTPHDPA